jgi:hypothetical protein
VRSIVRRVTFTLVAVIVAAAVSSTPAHAAGNPHTATDACTKTANGGNWKQVGNAPTPIKAGGTTVGDVYLMRDKPAGKYCSATIKRVDIGKKTSTTALVENGDVVRKDSGNFQYYAAAVLESRSVCIYFWGAMNFKGTVYQSESKAFCP